MVGLLVDRRHGTQDFFALTDPTVLFRLRSKHNDFYDNLFKGSNCADFGDKNQLLEILFCAIYQRAAYGRPMQEGYCDKAHTFFAKHVTETVAGASAEELHLYNERAFERLSGCETKDIILSSYSGLRNEPAFVLHVNHELKWLCVTCRGSYDIHDVVTDVEAIEEDFIVDNNVLFRTHFGMLKCAQFVFAKTEKWVERFFSVYKDPETGRIVDEHRYLDAMWEQELDKHGNPYERVLRKKNAEREELLRAEMIEQERQRKADEESWFNHINKMTSDLGDQMTQNVEKMKEDMNNQYESTMGWFTGNEIGSSSSIGGSQSISVNAVDNNHFGSSSSNMNSPNKGRSRKRDLRGNKGGANNTNSSANANDSKNNSSGASHPNGKRNSNSKEADPAALSAVNSKETLASISDNNENISTDPAKRKKSFGINDDIYEKRTSFTKSTKNGGKVKNVKKIAKRHFFENLHYEDRQAALSKLNTDDDEDEEDNTQLLNGKGKKIKTVDEFISNSGDDNSTSSKSKNQNIGKKVITVSKNNKNNTVYTSPASPSAPSTAKPMKTQIINTQTGKLMTVGGNFGSPTNVRSQNVDNSSKKSDKSSAIEKKKKSNSEKTSSTTAVSPSSLADRMESSSSKKAKKRISEGKNEQKFSTPNPNCKNSNDKNWPSLGSSPQADENIFGEKISTDKKPLFSDYQLVFTGHSLGAAVSTMLYYMFHKISPTRKKCVIFGCPGIINSNITAPLKHGDAAKFFQQGQRRSGTDGQNNADNSIGGGYFGTNDKNSKAKDKRRHTEDFKKNKKSHNVETTVDKRRNSDNSPKSVNDKLSDSQTTASQMTINSTFSSPDKNSSVSNKNLSPTSLSISLSNQATDGYPVASERDNSNFSPLSTDSVPMVRDLTGVVADQIDGVGRADSVENAPGMGMGIGAGFAKGSKKDGVNSNKYENSKSGKSGSAAVKSNAQNKPINLLAAMDNNFLNEDNSRILKYGEESANFDQLPASELVKKQNSKNKMLRK